MTDGWTPEDISPTQTAHATRLRVPFLTSPYPAWNYITGIVVSELWATVEPTEAEVEQVGQHLDRYCEYWYGERNAPIRQQMRQRPYDLDGSANLGYFGKRANGGWCYHKRTWRDQSWWPAALPDAVPLEVVLEKTIPPARTRLKKIGQ